MRNFLPETVVALAADCAVVYSLIEIRTPTPIFATNGHRKIEHAGEVYQVDTGLEKLPMITQEFSLSASSLSVSFSDVDNVLLAAAQNSNLYGAQLDIHIVALNTETDATLEVIPSVYRGYLDEVKPGDRKITFGFKNHMNKFTKTAGRRTNSPSQNRFYPDDKGFDKLTASTGSV